MFETETFESFLVWRLKWSMAPCLQGEGRVAKS